MCAMEACKELADLTSHLKAPVTPQALKIAKCVMFEHDPFCPRAGDMDSATFCLDPLLSPHHPRHQERLQEHRPSTGPLVRAGQFGASSRPLCRQVLPREEPEAKRPRSGPSARHPLPAQGSVVRAGSSMASAPGPMQNLGNAAEGHRLPAIENDRDVAEGAAFGLLAFAIGSEACERP